MLNLQSIEALLDLAFAEDIGIGDITTEATVPPSQKGIGTLHAKSDGIVAGLPIAEWTFKKLDSGLTFDSFVSDGDAVAAGTSIAEIQGSAKTILIGRANCSQLPSTTVWRSNVNITVCQSSRRL